ncbi:MAG: pectin esterase, partial [Duncaniella sp.]|nr:pectin esterase [Duncaniella sp.]
VIDGNEEARDGKQKLGRPWQGNPRTVYINATMLIPIDPKGWDDMGAIPELFAEYNSHDRYGKLLDMSQRKSHYSPKSRKDSESVSEGESRTQISKEEADTYTYEAIIRPEEGWDPRAMMAPLPAVRNLTYSDGMLRWDAVDGAIGYVIFDGDKIIGSVSETYMPIEKIDRALRIRAVNESGSMGLMTLLR